MKIWIAHADSPRDARTVKKNNDCLLLLFSNKMTHYFKEWTTTSGVLKKNILSLQKRDASNRLSSVVAVPKNHSTPKEN